jgi:hypothetical protein
MRIGGSSRSGEVPSAEKRPCVESRPCEPGALSQTEHNRVHAGEEHPYRSRPRRSSLSVVLHDQVIRGASPRRTRRPTGEARCATRLPALGVGASASLARRDRDRSPRSGPRQHLAIRRVEAARVFVTCGLRLRTSAWHLLVRRILTGGNVDGCTLWNGTHVFFGVSPGVAVGLSTSACRSIVRRGRPRRVRALEDRRAAAWRFRRCTGRTVTYT